MHAICWGNWSPCNYRRRCAQAAAVVSLILGGGATVGRAQEPPRVPRPTAGYQRPAMSTNQSRSVVISKHGMVASSHPLATLAGLDMLRQGGTAADAAIAANAVLGVVEPMSCGVGGDLFAIYWDAETRQLVGLNASGRSPAAISLELFRDRQLDEIPDDSILSWSVPGCVAGWEDLSGRFGKKPLAEVLAAAIEYAADGFPVSEVVANGWASSVDELQQWPETAATYLIEGEPPREGDVFRNPGLAATLRGIAADGTQFFYRGENAEKIARFSKQHGGVMTLEDLSEHKNEWVAPVSTTYRGYRVWELPPNGQGIAALQMLNVLEQFDIAAMGPGSSEYLHLFIEAKKLAFADRATYYADPAFGALPVQELISKEYARRRAAQIDRSRAADDVVAGDPKLQQGDTVYLTVVDRDRNCCSLIQSVYHGFGSKIVPGDVGYVMQNRGVLFVLDETHLNRLEPRKRPFHTIIPAMVTQHDRPVFCFGVMGGDMQPQGHVQVLVNIIDFGMNVQLAGDAARVRHTGSATPTGRPAEGVGTVHVEPAISEEVRAELAALGHHVHVSEPGGAFGGYQGIWIDWDRGTLHGATEARKDGVAIGY